MELSLTILAWTGIVLGALVGLVLFVPLSARARGRLSGLWGTGHVLVSWGWFVLVLRMAPGEGVRIRFFGIPVWRHKGHSRDEAEEGQDEASEDGKAKAKKRKQGPSAGHLWRNRRVLWWALLRLVRTLHLRGRLAGQVGLDDPADTAMVDLALGQLRERVRAVDWRVACDYADEVLEIQGEVRMWVWPIQVACVALATWLRRDVRRALRAGT